MVLFLNSHSSIREGPSLLRFPFVIALGIAEVVACTVATTCPAVCLGEQRYAARWKKATKALELLTTTAAADTTLLLQLLATTTAATDTTLLLLRLRLLRLLLLLIGFWAKPCNGL